MRCDRVVIGILSWALAGSSAMAATAPADCAAMVSLLHQARTDFQSLRQKKMEPGKCTLRETEYRCAWHFPGDAFDRSDAQAARLVQCVTAYPAAQTIKAPRGLPLGSAR